MIDVCLSVCLLVCLLKAYLKNQQNIVLWNLIFKLQTSQFDQFRNRSIHQKCLFTEHACVYISKQYFYDYGTVAYKSWSSIFHDGDRFCVGHSRFFFCCIVLCSVAVHLIILPCRSLHYLVHHYTALYVHHYIVFYCIVYQYVIISYCVCSLYKIVLNYLYVVMYCNAPY